MMLKDQGIPPEKYRKNEGSCDYPAINQSHTALFQITGNVPTLDPSIETSHG